MHIPAKFKETNPDVLHCFIEAYPLGTLISSTDNSLDADHIPFYLKRCENAKVVLQSHIAKTNPLWKKCANNQEILLVFHGPDAYISPNYYPSKKQTEKAVPTWNYAVVHVRGRITFKYESPWILEFLNNISDYHELNQNSPWSVTDAPADFIAKLVNAVVGLEVVIESLVGHFKLSQDKSAADYGGVLQALASSENTASIAVSRQMQNTARARKKHL